MTFNDDLDELHAKTRQLGEAILASAPWLAWLWRGGMRFTCWYLAAFDRGLRALMDGLMAGAVRLVTWLLRHPGWLGALALGVVALDALLLWYPLIGLAILLGALTGAFIGLLLAVCL